LVRFLYIKIVIGTIQIIRDTFSALFWYSPHLKSRKWWFKNFDLWFVKWNCVFKLTFDYKFLLPIQEKSEFKKIKKCPVTLSRPPPPPNVSRIIWMPPYHYMYKKLLSFNIAYRILILLVNSNEKKFFILLLHLW